MAVEIRFQIRCKSQQLNEVKKEVESALSDLMQSPSPIPLGQLTEYQAGHAPNCFLQHWCGPTENILAQYQTFKNLPNKLTCNVYLSMRGHRDHQGYVRYVGDDLEDVKAQTEELTLSIRRFLVRRRPWYIRAKWQWDVQVRSIQFFDPLKPTGVVGKFQNFWMIIFGVSKWFVGGVPILAAMVIAARLNNWDFLSQSTVSLTATGIGYFAFWVLWCIIDMARLAGKVRFNDK